MEHNCGLIDLASIPDRTLEEEFAALTYTGLPELDKLTGGFDVSTVTVWCGTCMQEKHRIFNLITRENQNKHTSAKIYTKGFGSFRNENKKIGIETIKSIMSANDADMLFVEGYEGKNDWTATDILNFSKSNDVYIHLSPDTDDVDDDICYDLNNLADLVLLVKKVSYDEVEVTVIKNRLHGKTGTVCVNMKGRN